jgi:hypothetical protein
MRKKGAKILHRIKSIRSIDRNEKIIFSDKNVTDKKEDQIKKRILFTCSRRELL